MRKLMNCRLSLLSIGVLSILVSGTTPAQAAPTPKLYPNKHLQAVGQDRARRDMRQCRVLAEDYIEENAYDARQSQRQDAVRRAARGAAMGALAGSITKNNAGRSAGAGAAMAGTSELLNRRTERREGSPEYKKYVEACLEDKGYKVVGWK